MGVFAVAPYSDGAYQRFVLKGIGVGNLPRFYHPKDFSGNMAEEPRNMNRHRRISKYNFQAQKLQMISSTNSSKFYSISL